jgi:hypothetical protein
VELPGPTGPDIRAPNRQRSAHAEPATAHRRNATPPDKVEPIRIAGIGAQTPPAGKFMMAILKGAAPYSIFSSFDHTLQTSFL